MEAVIEMDRIIKFFKIILKDSGLGVTYNDVLILRALEAEHKTLKEVSDFLLIDKSHVSKTLKRFQEEGTVDKRGRGHQIKFTLTYRGEKILKKTDELIDFVKKNDLKGLTGRMEKGVIKNFLGNFNSRLTTLYWES